MRREGKTNSGKLVTIDYTLCRRDDQWKVVNVYVNGLDLRDTFKSQFAQGMEQYNDIDKVIDNWSADAKIDAGIDEAKQGE